MRLLWALIVAACLTPAGIAGASFSGKVVAISDGDTIRVMHNGRAERIRLWGIDCPEKRQPFGTRATQFTGDLAFGKDVKVLGATWTAMGAPWARTARSARSPKKAALYHRCRTAPAAERHQTSDSKGVLQTSKLRGIMRPGGFQMRKVVICGCVAELLFGFSALAASLKIDLQWSGASYGNTATATGWMVIDTSQIPNPGTYLNMAALPSWLDGLSITVAGASDGNGTFTTPDFVGMYWLMPAGVSLDFTKPLFGQSTGSLPWGTRSDIFSCITGLACGGELNFFPADGTGAPRGVDIFTLAAADFDGNKMLLVSADPETVPEPAAWTLLLPAVLGLVVLRRRQA